MAAVSTPVALVNARSSENPDIGLCTGGSTYCWAFTNSCPRPWCEMGTTWDSEEESCIGSSGNWAGSIACSVLSEVECKVASYDCTFVPISSNQKAINAVLVAFTTISLVALLVIAGLLCRRLPVPNKEGSKLTQPLLNEENA